jgi:hypothetical protein
VFTKYLTDLTVPEHKLGVFECAVSNHNAQVTWLFNEQEVEKLPNKKRYQILAIGEFRRLAIRNCLLPENGTSVSCRLNELETNAKLYVTGK